MAGNRRVFSPVFKAKVVAEVAAHVAHGVTVHKATNDVGAEWRIHDTVLKRWYGESLQGHDWGHAGKRFNPNGRNATTYSEETRAAAVADLKSALPKQSYGAWQAIASKYGIHKTTLRAWTRRELVGDNKDPDTGQRTRALPSPLITRGPRGPYKRADAEKPPAPPAAAPLDPLLPAPVRSQELSMPPDPHVHGEPENALKWNILGAQSDANRYLAHRVNELEDEVRQLKAEKLVLMQAMGLVNSHRVVAPPLEKHDIS